MDKAINNNASSRLAFYVIFRNLDHKSLPLLVTIVRFQSHIHVRLHPVSGLIFIDHATGNFPSLTFELDT